MTHIAIVYHSGYGHTKRLAHAVEKGVLDVGMEVNLLKAEDLANPDQGPWDLLKSAGAIIFGAPTYMGAASSTFKQFADASSSAWMNHDWKDKLAAGFTNSGSIAGDKSATLNQMFILACQHGMIWVSPAFKPGFYARL